MGSPTRRSHAERRSSAYRANQNMKIKYFQRLIEATPLGMPRLAGTGPPGTACEQCCFYGYGAHPNSCFRYYLLMEKIGAAFPAETPSCRHFAPRWPDCNEILRR